MFWVYPAHQWTPQTFVCRRLRILMVWYINWRTSVSHSQLLSWLPIASRPSSVKSSWDLIDSQCRERKQLDRNNFRLLSLLCREDISMQIPLVFELLLHWHIHLFFDSSSTVHWSGSIVLLHSCQSTRFFTPFGDNYLCYEDHGIRSPLDDQTLATFFWV